MSILKIETGENNPILRQRARTVKKITLQTRRLILDMIETMEANNGAGLAAPQVGKSLRIIIAKPCQNQESLALINPEIIKKSFLKDALEEGCLSLPDQAISVKRPKKITVSASNIDGQKIEIKTGGILSRIIQHEIDHLNGILISDKKNV